MSFFLQAHNTHHYLTYWYGGCVCSSVGYYYRNFRYLNHECVCVCVRVCLRIRILWVCPQTVVLRRLSCAHAHHGNKKSLFHRAQRNFIFDVSLNGYTHEGTSDNRLYIFFSACPLIKITKLSYILYFSVQFRFFNTLRLLRKSPQTNVVPYLYTHACTLVCIYLILYNTLSTLN